MGIEPTTSLLLGVHSTAELQLLARLNMLFLFQFRKKAGLGDKNKKKKKKKPTSKASTKELEEIVAS